MGRTPVSSARRMVSSESVAVPEAQPWMVLVAQSIKGSDAGAEKRGGFGGVERFGHLRHGFRRGDHVLGVAAVVGDAADFFVDAVDEIAAAALQTGSIMATVPTDTHALALLPIGDARADFVDDARDFGARKARVGHAGPKAVFHEMVA